MTEIAAVALVLVAALVLRAIVSQILRRLSIFPDDESERSGGILDVRDWLRERRDRR